MKRVDLTLWVDALDPNPGGIGRYTAELAQGLTRHPAIGRLRFWGRNRILEDPSPLQRGEPLPPVHRRFGRLQAYWERHRLHADLFHGPNFFLPPFVRNGVITIHDLSVLLHPDTHPEERIRDYDLHFDRSVAAAKHIITVSETVRQEVISELGIAADRVTTVYNGVSSNFHPRSSEEIATGIELWDLSPSSYGLCVAALEPRKKLIELLESWRALPLALRSRFPLVLAGAPGWRNERIKEMIDTGTQEGWLRALGFVPEEQLPALYAGASLFLYPSTYEGFGLPPLEAMASGVPVMVARQSCLPEVCADAPFYIDPDDVPSFASSIADALESPDRRAQARERGLRRAADFTWARCVDETVAVYQKVSAAA